MRVIVALAFVVCLLSLASAGPFRGFGRRKQGWVQKWQSTPNRLDVRGGEDKSSPSHDSASPPQMSESTQAVLSVVPVFALTDEKGRPVLMRSTSEKSEAKRQMPQQLFFTDVEVARAHAASIMRFSGDEKLQLRLATLNLGQVWQMQAADREIRVYADPREVHFARQLLLRAAGFSNSNETTTGKAVDFSNETAVAETAASIQAAIGVDLEKDVPVFTVGVLNATLGDGGKVVQPWFLSFGDLVRAYVNSTTQATDDEAEFQRRAQTALRQMLAVGETAVTTVAKLINAIDMADTTDVFIMPPSSSLTVLAQARQAQHQHAKSSNPDQSDTLFGNESGSDAGLFD